MREMCDVSAILNNATASSLVLIDELGTCFIKHVVYYCF